MRLILLTLALFVGVATAADPIPKSSDAPPIITLDAGKAVTAPVGKKCVVEVKTTAKKVTWRLPEGIDSIALDGKRLAVWAVPGEYLLRAQVPNGEEVLEVDVKVTITGNVVTPPVDDTLKNLQAAYNSEPAVTRADDKAKLIAVYRVAAAGLGDLKTAGEVFTVIHNTTESRIADRLTKVRGVLNAEFDSFMPKPATTVLTAAQKAQAKSILTNYAKLLEEGVK